MQTSVCAAAAAPSSSSRRRDYPLACLPQTVGGPQQGSSPALPGLAPPHPSTACRAHLFRSAQWGESVSPLLRPLSRSDLETNLSQPVCPLPPTSWQSDFWRCAAAAGSPRVLMRWNGCQLKVPFSPWNRSADATFTFPMDFLRWVCEFTCRLLIFVWLFVLHQSQEHVRYQYWDKLLGCKKHVLTARHL